MTFKQWLEAQGCFVQVVQEDNGSGYEAMEVTPPDSNDTFNIAVQS